MLDKKEVEAITALICNEQNEIIRNNNYSSERYLELEKLKIKVKSLRKDK